MAIIEVKGRGSWRYGRRWLRVGFHPEEDKEVLRAAKEDALKYPWLVVHEDVDLMPDEAREVLENPPAPMLKLEDIERKRAEVLDAEAGIPPQTPPGFDQDAETETEPAEKDRSEAPIYACREEGCDRTFSHPGARGRHETAKHPDLAAKLAAGDDGAG